jgi:hypothetical protein
MNITRVTTIILLCFLTVGGGISQGREIPILPLSKIEPGMTGVGKTVYSGVRVDSFGVEVLDIMTNLYPKLDVIVVRLTGKEAEASGVISGMSGSPVYIDGKLIGALAMRFGQFMKEPIGAVMPIEAMRKITRFDDRPANTRYSGNSVPYINTVLCGGDSLPITPLADSPFAATGGLERIPIPLLCNGVSESVLTSFDPLLSRLGFVVVPGGSMQTTGTSEPVALQPGSAVAEVFVSGDVSISATGTVTDISPNGEVLAFGHQVFNLGPIQAPMAGARILTVLPSLMGSSKMALTTDLIGTFQQDRLTGVQGVLGELPPMVPVSLDIASTRGIEDQYQFQMAMGPSVNTFSPLFARIALFQAMIASRLASEPMSMRVKAEIGFDSAPTLTLSDFFSTERRFGVLETGGDVAEATAMIASALGALLVSDFETPTVNRLAISAQTEPGERVAEIRTIRQGQKTVEPGDTLLVKVDLQATDGTVMNFERHIPIPNPINGRMLNVLVGEGRRITQYEVRRNRDRFQPDSFEQLRRIFLDRRGNDSLYVQMRAIDRGMMVRGEELSALPPSIRQVMNNGRSSGDTKLMADRVIYEAADPTGYIVKGVKRLVVKVESPKKATVPEQEEMKKTYLY